MVNKGSRVNRRQRRVRARFPREGYRLTVTRSNRFLSAQVINQKDGRVVFGAIEQSLLKTVKGKTKSEKSREFGQLFAQKALAHQVKQVVFDRGARRYHGRVKAFAEGARASGLIF